MAKALAKQKFDVLILAYGILIRLASSPHHNTAW